MYEPERGNTQNQLGEDNGGSLICNDGPSVVAETIKINNFGIKKRSWNREKLLEIGEEWWIVKC